MTILRIVCTAQLTSYLQLLCDPGSVPIGTVSRSMPPRSSLSRFDERYGATALGARIPPELFPLLYGWVDGELARKCRLVCRYWEKQCRPRAFASIDLKGREKRVLDLAHFKYDPAWRHIPLLVQEVTDVGTPDYTDKPKAPWLHLLNPRWVKKWSIQLIGPFPGHPTIRSIHFTLPRSPPPSFSRGITGLMLENVDFRQFEDTACLISELPDLEDLWLKRVTWESLPNGLPRRRPRCDRNKLRKINLTDGSVKGAESSSFAFTTFALFLSVYSVSSFFSVDVATAVEAVLRIVRSEPSFFQAIHDPVRGISGAANVGELLFCSYGVSSHRSHALNCAGFYDISSDVFLAFCTPGRDSSGNSIISVLIDLDHEDVKFVDHSSDAWIHLNAVIETLPQRLQFLFGFQNRERMTRFAAALVNEKLPSLLRRGKARYAVARKERREGDYKEFKYWYQASLDLDELHGASMIYLLCGIRSDGCTAGDGTRELCKVWV